MASLEDHERRIAALEGAAERDRSVERAVAESERRTTGEIKRLREDVNAAEQRMAQRAEAAERRMVDVLNERFDAVMAALDRLSQRPGSARQLARDRCLPADGLQSQTRPPHPGPKLRGSGWLYPGSDCRCPGASTSCTRSSATRCGVILRKLSARNV
jgi:hypothetical protein